MRDQLRRLEELQSHDARIQELENSLKAIPAKLAATQADLARVEALLSTERQALGETEKYYGEQKGLLTEDEIQVAGAKHKLAQAKNSKEYMAAQREIEQRREALTAREGEGPARDRFPPVARLAGGGPTWIRTRDQAVMSRQL